MLLKEGEYLCFEGDKGDSLFIVMAGKLEAFSKCNNENNIQEFGPGSIIDELSLLEKKSREFTLKALENSEILEIKDGELDKILDEKPAWLKSILSFLTHRLHIAEENKEKGDLIQLLPSFLYVITDYQEKNFSQSIPLQYINAQLVHLNNAQKIHIERLLEIFEELGVIAVQSDFLHAKNNHLIPLLYETLKYRALQKDVSPHILSMTDQMILTSIVQFLEKNQLPITDGIFAIEFEILKTELKKNMHGMTLTARLLAPLLEKGLIQQKETILTGEFETIVDLLELNRIFPLLDKKLLVSAR